MRRERCWLDVASKTTPAVAEEYAHYTEGTWSSKGMLELIRQKMSAAALDSDDRPSTSTSSPLGTPCASLHSCVKLHAGQFKRLEDKFLTSTALPLDAACFAQFSNWDGLDHCSYALTQVQVVYAACAVAEGMLSMRRAAVRNRGVTRPHRGHTQHLWRQ